MASTDQNIKNVFNQYIRDKLGTKTINTSTGSWGSVLGLPTGQGGILPRTMPDHVRTTTGYTNILSDKARYQQSDLSQLASDTAAVSGFPSIESSAGAADLSTPTDWRARLRPKGRGTSFWSGTTVANGEAEQPELDYLLRPLFESGGLVWQYTPNIFVSGRATYDTQVFAGANYPYVTFNHSEPPQLVVVADFTANTVEEARYLLGIFHFLRVATKAFFGDSAVINEMYGTPPPVMLFEYMGDHGFNKVPVVVTDYQYQLGDDIDYVPVKTASGGQTETTYVPTLSNISITLQPSYTPHKLRKRFDLNKFTSGKGYKDGFI